MQEEQEEQELHFSTLEVVEEVQELLLVVEHSRSTFGLPAGRRGAVGSSPGGVGGVGAALLPPGGGGGGAGAAPVVGA